MSDWLVPQQDRLKYTQLFNLHDRTQAGSLPSSLCKDILLQSGLPKYVLAKIWNLSDIDNDGKLAREEFILAMYLVSCVKSGQSLPDQLQPDLIPPTYRSSQDAILIPEFLSPVGPSPTFYDYKLTAQYSTHIKSHTNGTSSVLNSSSFESKRRENFEKGRAELERRRLNIIEQQLVYLKSQLEFQKSQLLEAKTKTTNAVLGIEPKLKLLDSLNLQLGYVRRKRAVLDSDELNLETEAIDLNLNCSSQFLPLSSCRTSHIKEKLAVLLKDKESREKELNQSIENVEELKRKFKDLSLQAKEVYNNYTTKITSAKAELLHLRNANSTEADSVSYASIKPLIDCENLMSVEMRGNNEPTKFPNVKQINHSLRKQILFHDTSPGNDSSSENLQGLLESNKYKSYRVLYAFEARNKDELTIKPDEIVLGFEGNFEPGWRFGKIDGRKGLFPQAYVEPLFEAKPTLTQDSKIDSAERDPVKQNTSVQDMIQTKISYRVIYPFEARNSDELTIKPGDIVMALACDHEPGWLRGELNEKRGLFPESYVVPTDDPPYDQPRVDITIKTHSCHEGTQNGPSKSQLSHLIKELIATESDYVDDLRLCYDAYIKPLRSSFSSVDLMFINWKDLIQTHLSFLEKLSKYDKDDAQSYNSILKLYQNLLHDVIELYITNCSHQSESIKRFEAKLASDLRFKQLVNECERKIKRLIENQLSQSSHGDDCVLSAIANSRISQNLNLPLTSFMLKPMQRITKYKLIFERIQEAIRDGEHQELAELAEQLSLAAKGLCNEVNEACKLKEDSEENRRKLLWVQTHIKLTSSADSSISDSQSPISFSPKTQLELPGNSIDSNLLSSRKLIKAGSFVKERSSKEFVLFLFNDLLLITRVKGLAPLRVEDVFSSLKARRAYYKLHEDPIYLKDVTLHMRPDELVKQQPLAQDYEVGFSDRSTGASYIFSAINQQQQIGWMKELELLISETKLSCHQHQGLIDSLI